MAEFLEFLSGQSEKELNRIVDLLEQMAKNVDTINASFKQLKTPSGIAKGLDQANKSVMESNKLAEKARLETIKLEQARERAADKYERQLRQQQKARERQVNAESRVRQSLERQRQREERARAKEAADLAKANNLYNKIQVKINSLSQTYNNLAAKKELGLKLSKREEAQLNSLEGRLSKYQGVLSKVDANIGKYNRNVGNYASGWNGLGTSINQLTREMPAFANSMQTGFMAISNNIPMLVDEINNLKTANRTLRAEGKATKSVMAQLGASIFSWQTAISVGVTLLTVYGAELFEMAFGASEAEKAIKKTNEALVDAKTSSIEATNSIENLRDIVLDETAAEEARRKAYQELQDELPTLTDLTYDQVAADKEMNGAAKDFIETTNLYITAIQARANAEALSTIIAERRAEIIKDQTAGLEDNISFTQYAMAAIKSLGNTSSFSTKLITEGAKAQSEAIAENEKILESLTEEQRRELELALKLEEMLKLNTSATDENTKAKERALVKGTEAYLENLIKLLREEQLWTAENSKEWRYYQTRIEDVQRAIQKLKGELYGLMEFEHSYMFDGEELNSWKDYYERLAESRQKDTESLEEYYNRIEKTRQDDLAREERASERRRQIIFDSFQRIGDIYGIDLTRFQNLFDGKENTVQDYANAAEDLLLGVGNAIFQGNINRINAEIAANDEKYSREIEAAEGNERKQEMLRLEQERKRRNLERQRMQQEKQAAIFNSIIQTAAAVVTALAQGGLPLAVIVGALGAAQTALIAAQPIPQYKKGRKGGKEEIAILGDGYKNEPVTDKKGNLKFISPNKPTLMPLEAGDTVHPSMEALRKASVMASLDGMQDKANDYDAGNNFERRLLEQGKQIERNVIKSLRKAKFINENHNHVDISKALKKLKYK